ncbi:unnamed protein product [Cylindrotheca closterium]|uniref:Uncharacterized protein n=1 Tax=Cylindrotheca closterium TaxID=2856 RepID=A0AAD2FYG2_9STRA|nr:unnamed protein product [Cylindrotheca closterium]
MSTTSSVDSANQAADFLPETNEATVVDEMKEEKHNEADEKQQQEAGESEETQKVQNEEALAQTMSLDVAYKSLEMIRKVNLQVEFGREIEDTECVLSLRQAREAPELMPGTQSRFRRWVSEKSVPKASPCLTCGTPVSKAFRSPEFARQNIVVCVDCANLFSLDYLMKNIVHSEVDSIDSTETRKRKMNHMLEVYDRALLILTYSVQFIDDVVVALEQNTSRHNKVGLGSSATGMVSGGLGVAAAATIFTPVGPPLLLASILFGSGAAAADAASEAVNYRGEPNKMADRILTLNSIIGCISRLPATIDMETTAEEEDVIHTAEGQASLHWRRTAMNGLKPLTAGALSAVSIFTEAREMKSTVAKIRAGNPCEKAERLKQVKENVPFLPKTDILSNQLQGALRRQHEIASSQNETKSSTDEVTTTADEATADDDTAST